MSFGFALRGFASRVILAPTLLVVGLIVAFFCLAFEVPDWTSYPILVATLVVSSLLSIVSLIRAVRRFRFMNELQGILKRVESGDVSRQFTFLCAKNHEDLVISRSFSSAMQATHRRFQAVLQERLREEAILGSMAEGVLVIDPNERIIRINDAAAVVLGVVAEEVISRKVREAIRSTSVQDFVASLLRGESPDVCDTHLRGSSERYLQMTGRELKDADGQRIGGIVVLSDVTRLRRLERTRSDFIANVSHELKTPVTSIRGFAETLLDGALDNPEDARRFLGIISKQAERLSQIFDDMLVLSHLEREEEIEVEESDVESVIVSAIQSCELKALNKDILINRECVSGLRALISPPVLEQAVLNLIDNAIKYSPRGSRVKVRTCLGGTHVRIEVEDNGPGIEAKHLPRIFERFYRVDKGRSRAEGGTGLGLAIVKHIAQIHGGHAEVSSAPGKGSVFAIFVRAASELDPELQLQVVG